MRLTIKKLVFACSMLFGASMLLVAQVPTETPPPPSAPRSVNIPAVKEIKLPNGLTVAVIQKKGLPLVTASLLIRAGANVEGEQNAGLADMTASLLTKGTKTRTAADISQQIDFLGANIGSNAGWNSSSITINSLRSNLDKALDVMSDVALNPVFPEDEIDLLKKRTLDGIKASMKRPGALLRFVATRYSFGEHLSSGTPESIGRFTREGIEKFYRSNYGPANSVLIFTGDITADDAITYASRFFGNWKKGNSVTLFDELKGYRKDLEDPNKIIRRIVVIDLPDSGQAAVGYVKNLNVGRVSCTRRKATCKSSDVYFPASVLNSILGGGYSARLNQEIRLKRGLSYGARSGFSWRPYSVNFTASAQTKNESAAHVAELVRLEISKLTNGNVGSTELTPRKAVVTGGFGRGLQTNSGLVRQLRDLYLYNVNPQELNTYMNNVNAVSAANIKDFASNNLRGGDMIIVGDSKMFMDDLKKRFPDEKVARISASRLDFNFANLRKPTEGK